MNARPGAHDGVGVVDGGREPTKEDRSPETSPAGEADARRPEESAVGAENRATVTGTGRFMTAHSNGNWSCSQAIDDAAAERSKGGPASRAEFPRRARSEERCTRLIARKGFGLPAQGSGARRGTVLHEIRKVYLLPARTKTVRLSRRRCVPGQVCGRHRGDAVVDGL
jgi:hypothetical protein